MKSKNNNISKKHDKKVQQPAAQKGTLLFGYSQFLMNIKKQIKSSQIKAVLAVNKELISLYWDIGKSIYKKQKEEGWGSKIIDTLAKDLNTDFHRVYFRHNKTLIMRSNQFRLVNCSAMAQ